MPNVLPPRGLAFLTHSGSPDDVVIPDDMGSDERMLMQALQEFATQEVVPVLDRIEQRDESVILPLFRKAADLGIFMAEVPEEHGGLGLNVLAIAGMSESRAVLGGLASTIFAHQGIGTLPLINFGTQDQIERYLGRCMDGSLMAAFALTEPGSGSDAMNISTTAVLDDDGATYVVNGAKQWITNAGWADLFILFAKVDGTAFTAFLLERDTPGLAVGTHEHLLGLHGSSVCGLTLQDVRIPASNVLGEVGRGHKVALCTLNLGRMKMAANCAVTSKKALTLAVEYATERRQFGHAIADFGLIQRKLAEMATRAYAAESVAYRTAGLVYHAAESSPDASPSLERKLSTLTEFASECAMAKVFGTETYHALADELLQVFGGNGYSEEYPAARMYRDARITRIYEGTSEICRLSVARAMLKRLKADDTWLQEDGPTATPTGVDAESQTNLDILRRWFGRLFRRAVDDVGIEGLREHHRQQLLSSLADVAIELYAAESTLLRVARIEMTRPEADTTLARDLATLGLARGVERIRVEATEILAAVCSGDDLRNELLVLTQELPCPPNLLEVRTRVAHALVERGGKLPSFPTA